MRFSTKYKKYREQHPIIYISLALANDKLLMYIIIFGLINIVMYKSIKEEKDNKKFYFVLIYT